jgi:hypothetical protein
MVIVMGEGDVRTLESFLMRWGGIGGGGMIPSLESAVGCPVEASSKIFFPKNFDDNFFFAFFLISVSGFRDGFETEGG